VLKGPIASATLRTSVVLGIRLVLQAGTLLLVARVLGPSQFGAYAGIAAIAILLAPLTTFGIPLVLLAETSQALHRRLRVLPYALSTALIIGSLLFVVFLLVALGAFAGSPVPPSLVILIGLTEIIIQPLINYPSVQLQAQRRIAASQLVHLTPLGLRFLTIAYIFTNPVDQPLAVFLIASLFAGLIGLVVASVAMSQAWPAFRHWRLASGNELRRAAGFAVAGFASKGPTEIDKSLAARLLPLDAAGVYSGAARIVGAVNIPVSSMIQSALPTLFSQARSDSGIRKHMLATLFFLAGGYGTIAALIMWQLVPVIGWVFGDAYAGIEEAATWLCLAIPGTMLRVTSGAILVAREQPLARTSVELCGLASIIVAAIIFAPRLGILGMIAAYVVAEWVMAILAAAFVLQYSRRKA